MQIKHPFLEGGGQLGALMRSHDWSTSSLGSPEFWPESLRSMVSFLLNSKFPMFLAWGDDLAILYNDAYAQVMGAKHPAALGMKFERVWAEIWDNLVPLVKQALAGEAVFLENLPLTMTRKGYEEATWFTFSYSPVRDESGGVKGMACVCIETTAQVLAERASLEENKRLQGLFAKAPSMIAVMRGPQHVFEIANDAFYDFVGRRDVIGRPVREMFPDLEGQVFFELLDGVYARGERYKAASAPIVLRRADGSSEEQFFNFIYEPIRDEAGCVSGIFYEGFDVTESVKAAQALKASEQLAQDAATLAKESEAKFRTIADAMPQMVWSARPDGHHDYFNQQWYEYCGLDEGATDGAGWGEIVHPEDRGPASERWQGSLANGNAYEMLYRLRHNSGQYRWALARAHPVRDDAGNVTRWMGTCTDIHDQKVTEEELQAANRRKDEFLAMLAHELRNPLAPISTAAQLLQTAGVDGLMVKRSSEIIARQVKHMTDLVDDLLDVSRVTRGLVELARDVIDMKTVVHNAIEQARPLIEARKHTLSTHMVSAQAQVMGDNTRLTQVVTNLLNNAAKYTAPGGAIALTLTVESSQVVIDVVDNGTGIDPALLPRVFDLFTQAERTPDRSQGGLGLGLALVKSMMTLHGGSVEARSAGHGSGSTFSLTLPLLDASAALAACQNAPGQQPLHNRSRTRRIMVVDDNLDAAEMLATLLRAAGHLVVLESAPVPALNTARAEAVEVFVLDIGLPGMDGYELARRLRALPGKGNAVYVALTGYGQEEDKQLSKAAGFDHHFVKPVDFKQLAELLGA